MSDAPRPKQHLIKAGKRYAGAWKNVDYFREHKGRGLPDWPDWCFIPISATYSIVADALGVDGSYLPLVAPERMSDPAILAALASWRVTQGVYRFDPDVYQSVVTTPIDRSLPADVFYRLPEWSVYIETPDMQWGASQAFGFWAHLEFDINTGRHELRLVIDAESELTPLPIHLGDWSLVEAMRRVNDVATYHATYQGMTRFVAQVEEHDNGLAGTAASLQPFLSLLLFVCSQASEVGSAKHRPTNPTPKRTKKGWRLFGAEKATVWDVGVRIGSALRKAYSATSERSAMKGEGGRSSPRAHVRRAHWHGFWKGSKDPTRADERQLFLKWVPPIPINVESNDEMPVTIRPVKE